MSLKLSRRSSIDEADTVNPKLTYIDSGVLISTFRGTSEISVQTAMILDDPSRQFASSPFVQLETLPKAIYHRQSDEQAFYDAFFAAVSVWANDLDVIVEVAKSIAANYGIAAMDSLHIAAALAIEAKEFVTTEKPTKPMFRVKEIVVRSVIDELFRRGARLQAGRKGGGCRVFLLIHGELS
jgi:predicted nucleic acid-binding protein